MRSYKKKSKKSYKRKNNYVKKSKLRSKRKIFKKSKLRGGESHKKAASLLGLNEELLKHARNMYK